MNKNIILLAMLFAASAIFISCDRNNDDPTPEIVLTSPDGGTIRFCSSICNFFRNLL